MSRRRIDPTATQRRAGSPGRKRRAATTGEAALRPPRLPAQRPGPEGGARDANRRARLRQLGEAALELFLAEGIPGVTIDQIVESAGVAKGELLPLLPRQGGAGRQPARAAGREGRIDVHQLARSSCRRARRGPGFGRLSRSRASGGRRDCGPPTRRAALFARSARTRHRSARAGPPARRPGRRSGGVAERACARSRAASRS